MDGLCTISVDASNRVNLAAQHNAVPFLAELRIGNPTGQALRDLKVRVRGEPAFVHPLDIPLPVLAAGAEKRVDTSDLRLAGSYLRDLRERVPARLYVEVLAGEEAVGATHRDVEVLAGNEWSGVEGLPELLAAFVCPNERALAPLVRAAAARLEASTGRADLDGYQARSPDRVRSMVEAVYQAVADHGIRYVSPPASFEKSGQKIRLPNEVLEDGLATCLDLTVLLAALLEHVGLHPLLVLIEGHAFPGAWLVDRSTEAVLDESSTLTKRIRLDELVVFDSSAVTSTAGFDAAVAKGRGYLEDPSAFVYAVDVRGARSQRILPLDRTLAPVPVEGAIREAPVAPVPRPSVTEVEMSDESRRPTPESRLDRWKAKLLDLTLRNALISFKNTKRTLTIDVVDLPGLEDELAAGRAFQLLARPGVLDDGDPRDSGSHRALTGDDGRLQYLGEEQARHRLHTGSTDADFQKRVKELYSRSRGALQENGATTLYLGLGMLRWFESDSSQIERWAPVLLVPVELERQAAGKWSLRGVDEETRVNVSLLKKLKDEFALDVAGLDELPEDASGVDVAAILRSFTQLVVGMKRWQVEDRCVLAEFNFQKFLMWLDLEAKTEHLLENEVVRHIFEGGGEAFPMETEFPPLEGLDEKQGNTDIVPVVIADPSQMQAILAAVEGNSFVLQGPPGTGKSQTITNLIAALLSVGKTVLFVSEKMAALEVVHRRLEGVGLGPFSLELHSHQTNKKAVLESLARALEGADQQEPAAWVEKSTELASMRSSLNEVASMLRQVTPFGLTTQATLEQLIAQAGSPRIVLADAVLDRVDSGWLRRLDVLMEEVGVALEESGPPATHPWKGFLPGEWTPRMERQIGEALDQVVHHGRALRSHVSAASTVLGLPEAGPNTYDLAKIARVGELLISSPCPPLGLLAERSEAEVGQAVAKVTPHLQRYQDAHGTVAQTFGDQILGEDVVALRKRLAAWQGVFFLFAWIMTFTTKRNLRALLKAGEDLPDDATLLELLENAHAAQEEKGALDALEPEVRGLFGAHWGGLDTDAARLTALASHSRDLRRAVLELTADLDITVAPNVREHIQRLYTSDHALVEVESERGQTLLTLGQTAASYRQAREQLDELLSCSFDVPDEDWPEEAARLREHLGHLKAWSVTLRRLDALRSHGVPELAAAIEDGRMNGADLALSARRSLLELWWERATEQRPLLRRFRGVDHERAIERFHELDDDVHLMGQDVVGARIAAQVPALSAPGPEMALLRHQLQLTRNHMPLRKLFAKMPTLFKRLKPCVLMSPLSVAQFLDPELPSYDVVVFDEASQIPPWDAVGAIARGKQVVVVGDSKQLPPTTFFSAGGGEEEPGEDDRVDLDSILEEVVSAGLPQHRLTWHYRSRHESLIAFSNHHYYDSRLNTFPPAALAVEELGVHLRHVEGFYDRGGSRTNRAEAEAIRDHLLEVACMPDGERPTVGVVTFSAAQQRLVEDLVELARSTDPRFEALFEGTEPLFVKNLENVQGDERDLILFSICYGPDRLGRVAMAFGPLNRDGGERRLNVAVTRARNKVVVFSTLRADQIDLKRTRSVGVKHLKRYLEYAERGMVALDAALDVDPDAQVESPLEAEIKAALDADGWDVDCQVGVSGYRIDLAIKDPKRPGAYVLGVECDGASYHSSAVARERDRLRQQVLESLGWRIHRVWSTDWWTDRERTTQRLLSKVREAVELAHQQHPWVAEPPSAREAPVVDTPSPAVEEAVPAGDPTTALERMRFALAEAKTAAAEPDAKNWRQPWLASIGSVDLYSEEGRRVAGERLEELVRTHGPLEAEHAFGILREAWGFGRLGKKIRSAFEDGLAGLPPERRPRLFYGALFPVRVEPVTWEEFRVPGDVRGVGEIPLIEVANAQAWVVRRGEGMPVDEEEMFRESMKVLGLKSLGKKVRERSNEALVLLLAKPDIEREPGEEGWTYLSKG